MPQNLPEVPPLDTAVPVPPLDEYNVALLIGDTVYEVINTNAQGAARFLAQPTFVQISPGECGIGWVYDENTGTFSRPQ